MSHGMNPGPPPPPPPVVGPSGRARFMADVPVGVVAAVLVQVAIVTAVIWAFFFRSDDEEALVYERYNDALVSGDLAAAWGLTCPTDRERKPLADFERWVEESTRQVGELESWSRLRGGAEWHGTRGDVQRRPEIIEQDGHDCVHNVLNALGDTF